MKVVVAITFYLSMGIIGIVSGYNIPNMIGLVSSISAGIFLIGTGVYFLIRTCKENK
ncbi:hypothetical protein RCIP0012_00066 [Klebsiella phage RCIP0012]